MMPVAPARPTRHALRAALLALVAGSLLASGCGSQDANARRIQQATDRLNALSGGGQSYPIAESDREKSLRAILADVQAVGDTATGSQQAAVALITAQANTALGDIKASGAGWHERRALNSVQTLRALVRTYVTQSANAAAAEQFNPADAISALGTQLTAKQEAAASEHDKLQKMETEVDQLKLKGEALSNQATAKRNEASSIRGQAQGQSQVAQLAAFERAAAVSRESSQLASQASMIDADVKARTPLVTAQKAMVDARTEEVSRLQASIAELQGRQGVAMELAKIARTESIQAASEFQELLGQVDALRAGDLATATDAALTAYQAARSAASKVPQDSSADDKSALKLAAAVAQQGRGDTLLIRARGLDALVAVLARAKDAQPAMPGQDKIAAAHDARAAELTTMLAEARAALGEAAGSFESLGGAKGALVAERADYVAKTLKWIEAGDLSAPQPTFGDAPVTPAAAPAAPAAASTAATTPTTAAAATTTDAGTVVAIKTAVGAMVDALKAENAGQFMAACHVESEDDRPFLVAACKATVAAITLEKAMQAKFGKGMADLPGMPPPISNAGKMAQMVLTFSPDQLEVISASADQATVKAPWDVTNVTLMKFVGGKWLASLSPEDSEKMRQTPGGIALIDGISTTFSELAADINSGKLGTVQQFMGALGQKMQALQGLMGGPGGPGPRGPGGG